MISSFGDPRDNSVNDWVPLLTADFPPLPVLTTSIDFVIVYSVVGKIPSPQAKIIAAYLSSVPQEVMCAANLSRVMLQTSVRFIDKSVPAVTKFAQPPVYEIKLPRDFFYPFLSGSAKGSISLEFILLLTVLVFSTTAIS